MHLISVAVFIAVIRWLKKRCFVLSNVDRAADLACALSVRGPPSRPLPVMCVASRAAVRLLCITSKAPA